MVTSGGYPDPLPPYLVPTMGFHPRSSRRCLHSRSQKLGEISEASNSTVWAEAVPPSRVCVATIARLFFRMVVMVDLVSVGGASGPNGKVTRPQSYTFWHKAIDTYP